MEILAWRRQPGSLPSRTIPAVRRHSSALRRLVAFAGRARYDEAATGDVRCRGALWQTRTVPKW